MSQQAVKAYLDQYKANFERVHLEEIYKWKAIKQFQDSFDIHAKDFLANLDTSLSKAENLLISQNYFPKNMVLENAEVTPEKVRQLFLLLFDEEAGLLQRVEQFQKGFVALNQKNFPGKKDYQDHRAIMVYLTLRYPERYFFYKFTMFKDFAEKVGYPYKPVGGRLSNIGQYQNLCKLVRSEITTDQELLKLHKERIGEDCYYDENLNILTQDFIYAVNFHLGRIAAPAPAVKRQPKVERVNASTLEVQAGAIDLTPKVTNHLENSRKNKQVGDLGELWVVRYERDGLIRDGKPGLAEKIKHAAKDEGDGLGYDILSYHPDGQKKYIEVKTTKGPENATFYLTRNELERSRMENENYYLYRVYHYNEQTDEADLLIIQGGLTNLCTVPLTFKVDLKNGNE